MSDDFWSRRRAAVAAEADDQRKAEEQALLAEEHAALEQRSDEEILEQLKLPDPESLEKGDDFSVFMAKAVPDRIRRRALRTLWKSNPVLANVDHLVEYGEDYTDSATVIENLQTAYQVGKGMLKHVEEMARQAAEADAEALDETPVEGADEEILTAEAAPPVEAAVAPQPEADAEEVDMAADVAPAAPRRMKFRVEETA